MALFPVGGVSCLVNSVNERGLSLLNSVKNDSYLMNFRGTLRVERKEVRGNHKSVMS